MLRSMPPNFHLILQYFKNENPSIYLFQEWKSLKEIESEHTEFKTMEGYFLSSRFSRHMTLFAYGIRLVLRMGFEILVEVLLV